MGERPVLVDGHEVQLIVHLSVLDFELLVALGQLSSKAQSLWEGLRNLHGCRLSGLRDGQIDLLVEDVVDDHVAEDGEPYIQPAGEDDGQLWVRPGAAFESTLFLNQFPCFQGITQSCQIGLGLVALPEFVETASELLRCLGHVEVAVLAEVEDGGRPCAAGHRALR